MRLNHVEVKKVTDLAIEAMTEVIEAIVKKNIEDQLYKSVKEKVEEEFAKQEKKLKYVTKRASAAQDRYKVLAKNHEALLARQDRFIRHIPHVFAIMHEKYGNMNISPATYGKMAKDCLKYQMDEID